MNFPLCGLTGNFENTDTDYTNGIDWHTDWGASKFLSKQLFVGLVGYVYDQITGDSGSGDKVGPFESRVIGVGPQLGYLFPVGEHAGLYEPEGLQRIRCGAPAGRLERLADIRVFAGCAQTDNTGEANDH